MDIFRDQIVLITGAAGTVGRELIRQLMAHSPAEIRLLDNNESELFLLSERYRHHSQVNAYLGDVRDALKIQNITRGVVTIFHCAAFKHVIFSEYNPFDTVQNNILGVENVIQAALTNKVKQLVFTSSDKAVNPTSVMGTSKLMGERLITAANVVNNNSYQRFSSVRFGNVLGSRGSVFGIFQEQIRKGGPVTVTHKDMTRFIMTVERAADLVLKSVILAQGGEVFVTKMVAIRIMDLAKAMIELLAPCYGLDPQRINIEFIGPKPGEKMYEELLSVDEVQRSRDLQDMFVVLPAFRSIYQNIEYNYPGNSQCRVDRPYTSSQEPFLSKEEIKNFLIKNNMFPNQSFLENREFPKALCGS